MSARLALARGCGAGTSRGAIGTIAYDEIGMTAEAIRTDALSAAGFLSAAVAAASLLKSRK